MLHVNINTFPKSVIKYRIASYYVVYAVQLVYMYINHSLKYYYVNSKCIAIKYNKLFVTEQKPIDTWSMSVYIRLCPSMSVYVRLCPSMCVYVRPCPSMSVYIRLCPSMSGYVRPCPSMSVGGQSKLFLV